MSDSEQSSYSDSCDTRTVNSYIVSVKPKTEKQLIAFKNARMTREIRSIERIQHKLSKKIQEFESKYKQPFPNSIPLKTTLTVRHRPTSREVFGC